MFQRFTEMAGKASLTNIKHDLDNLGQSFPHSPAAASKHLFTLIENVTLARHNGMSDADVTATIKSKANSLSPELHHIATAAHSLVTASASGDSSRVAELDAEINRIFRETTGSSLDASQTPLLARIGMARHDLWHTRLGRSIRYYFVWVLFFPFALVFFGREFAFTIVAAVILAIFVGKLTMYLGTILAMPLTAIAFVIDSTRVKALALVVDISVRSYILLGFTSVILAYFHATFLNHSVGARVVAWLAAALICTGPAIALAKDFTAKMDSPEARARLGFRYQEFWSRGMKMYYSLVIISVVGFAVLSVAPAIRMVGWGWLIRMLNIAL